VEKNRCIVFQHKEIVILLSGNFNHGATDAFEKRIENNFGQEQ
jgi:hypothetical protein